MCSIIGVFNNEKSVELVLKGLEMLVTRSNAEFWLCTDTDEVYGNNVDELKRKITRGSINCLGCYSCKPFSPKNGYAGEFVADAEIYAVGTLKKNSRHQGESSYDVLLKLMESSRDFEQTVDGAYACAWWRRGNAHGGEVY